MGDDEEVEAAGLYTGLCSTSTESGFSWASAEEEKHSCRHWAAQWRSGLYTCLTRRRSLVPSGPGVLSTRSTVPVDRQRECLVTMGTVRGAGTDCSSPVTLRGKWLEVNEKHFHISSQTRLYWAQHFTLICRNQPHISLRIQKQRGVKKFQDVEAGRDPEVKDVLQNSTAGRSSLMETHLQKKWMETETKRFVFLFYKDFIF